MNTKYMADALGALQAWQNRQEALQTESAKIVLAQMHPEADKYDREHFVWGWLAAFWKHPRLAPDSGLRSRYHAWHAEMWLNGYDTYSHWANARHIECLGQIGNDDYDVFVPGTNKQQVYVTLNEWTTLRISQGLIHPDVPRHARVLVIFYEGFWYPDPIE